MERIANGMTVGDTTIFDLRIGENGVTKDSLATRWEAEYARVIDPKYTKGRRRFRESITTPPNTGYEDNPPIYVIPRERGGPSYKSVPLEYGGTDVVYCPISKGYSMGDVSSFTLGPVTGEGLCIVNSAFSKGIYSFHLTGGRLDLSRKSFWRKARKPTRLVRVKGVPGSPILEVDGVDYPAHEWLRANEESWLPEWEKWHRCVALASIGSFHWDQDELAVAFRLSSANNKGEYVDFVEWKKRAYIMPAYELLPKTKVYQYLERVRSMGYGLGLVHPKGREAGKEKAITKESTRLLYDDEYGMSCMPYCVAGMLLDVPVYEE